MITPFLRARQGWGATNYMHPDLEPILAETSGVVVFHEQVMRIVSVMTGCSLEAADLIRRRMGDYEQLDEIREWFYKSLRTRGYKLEVIEQVWDVLRSFASFGFCKAHAAAFALPTYQSAWFKAHHPAAFVAGVLTHDPGMYPKRLIADDARSFGVEILGLDVNRSSDTYAVEKTVTGEFGIRISLAEVKGISSQEVANIIHAAYLNKVKKLLFLGSSCIYPKNAPQPLKEEYLLSGYLESTNQPYAIAKIAGIEMCDSYRAQYGCNFISAMPTNLYGTNDN
jgi:error-prone DNA polymerase